MISINQFVDYEEQVIGRGEYYGWQKPLNSWLKPLNDWQSPLREWQSPLVDWQNLNLSQKIQDPTDEETEVTDANTEDKLVEAQTQTGEDSEASSKPYQMKTRKCGTYTRDRKGNMTSWLAKTTKDCSEIFDRIEHLQMDDKSLKSSSSFYSSGSSYPDYESSYNTSPQSESPSTSQRFMIFSKAKCKSCVKKRFFKICQKCGSSVLIKRNVSAVRKYQPNDSTSES